ncbi:hypothetical protein GGR54DRAFT_642591 [Hypoxylon sp. NC1633]|nr:hypothetical protein GGR54DRAFT_642591 [Hypoxylon sp. NC1633]
METQVPTPRQFLTSLVDSLASIPTPEVAASSSTAPGRGAGAGAGTNPLKLIPTAYRPLLTTLYALYPLTLLPALDLLDRRLATRVVVRPSDSHSHSHSDHQPHPKQQTTATTPSTTATRTKTQPEAEAHPPSQPNPPQPHNKEPFSEKPEQEEHQATNHPKACRAYYLVRSAQPTHPRRHHGGNDSASTSSAGQSYVVRLDAWNCTCAAFAFAAFPRDDNQQHASYAIDPYSPPSSLSGPPGQTSRVSGGKRQSWREGIEEAIWRTEGQEQGGEGERGAPWQFGALSLDGVEGSGIAGVPCCKHLLACVLAERWSGVLGGYVEERVVSKEEGAGLVADV